VKHRSNIFHSRVGLDWIPQKSASGNVAGNLCFPSGGICRSSSAFWCVRGMKYRSTILHARVGPVRIPQKSIRTHYGDLVFLHPVGSACHVVHSCASGMQNIGTLFLCWGDRYGFDKKHIRTRYIKLVFLHSVGSTGHVVHSGASGT
jgi:hypothetical protein